MITAPSPGSRRLAELSPRLAAASAELAQRMGRAPTATELATALDMDREEVIDVLVVGTSQSMLPITGAAGAQDISACGGNLGEWVANLDHIGEREALRPLLAALPEGERTVVVLRFFESLTQTQIAERVGLPPIHVSQLLAKALTQLRKQLYGSAAVTQVA